MRPQIRHLFDRDALGALVLAASLPLLFLHERYQPELAVDVGSTSVDVRLSDAAVLVVGGGAAAAATGVVIATGGDEASPPR